MAVYTHLSDSDIDTLLRSQYQRRLLSANAIDAGTENTNYRVTTQTLDDERREKFVLTVFEHTSQHELTPIIALTHTLANAGIAVPSCITTLDDARFVTALDKPAVMTPFAQGEHPERPSIAQCEAVSRALAAIHLTPFDGRLVAYDPVAKVEQLAIQLKSTLSDDDNALIQHELTHCADIKHALRSLPSGVLHTDLFTDNALFTGESLSALLDFYSAARGVFLFDLAVLINDWCVEVTDSTTHAVTHHLDKQAAVLSAYQQIRLLSNDERTLLPSALRLMACRFWLSRHALLQQHGHVPDSKSPEAFKQRLLLHLATHA
ncbi:MAG: phosphotransferase [Pseudomonadota bacterium]